MLYVTTRSKSDVHTSVHALTKDRAGDGGLYVPFRLPFFTEAEMDGLMEKTFSETVCYMLKLLLGADLNSSNVDFQIGRNPVRLVPLSHKIIVGETWRNPDWRFSRLVRSLIAQVCAADVQSACVSSWAEIAVRISVLFGLFGMLRRQRLTQPGQTVDVAVDDEDLSAVLSILYARVMGLPVGSAVCSCREDSPLWELVHTGQLQPDRPDRTVPENMERLVFRLFGFSHTEEYLKCRKQGSAFQLMPQQKKLLREAVSASVVSGRRIESMIPSVYKTNGYILAPDSAFAYGGLLDHRSRCAERRTALILSERSPLCDIQTVARCMNISEQELKDRIFVK